MKFTKKSALVVLVVLVMALGLVMVFRHLSCKQNVQEQTVASLSGRSVIEEDGIYINKKYNFTLDFPKNWTGCQVEEGENETKFSLKNTKGEYVPVLLMKTQVWGGEPIPEKYYELMGTGNLQIIITALVDKDTAQFGGAFAANDYPGIDTDLKNYIVPTATGIMSAGLRGTNEFRLSDVKVGEQIGLMKIESILPANDGSNAGQGLASTSPKDISIKFSSEVSLTGNYSYGNFDLNTHTFGDICFYDSSEHSLLPMLVQSRNAMICFSNQDLAKEKFQPEGSTGEVQITINNFTINNSVDGKAANTATLVSVTPSGEQTSKPVDTSGWVTFKSKELGISLKTPKEVYDSGVGMAPLNVIADVVKETITVSFSSYPELKFYVVDVKDDADLDKIINSWAKENEVGTGCRMGFKSAWSFQEGVYDVKMQGEDWNSQEVDLGTTTCSWGAPNQILYFPAKHKAVMVFTGQDARFSGNAENSITYDGGILESVRFE